MRGWLILITCCVDHGSATLIVFMDMCHVCICVVISFSCFRQLFMCAIDMCVGDVGVCMCNEFGDNVTCPQVFVSSKLHRVPWPLARQNDACNRSRVVGALTLAFDIGEVDE